MDPADEGAEARPVPPAGPARRVLAAAEPTTGVVARISEVPDPVAGTEPFGDDYDTLVQVAEDTLDAVDRALARLDDGSYGRCEECGGPIGDDLLVADPATASCERHLRRVGA